MGNDTEILALKALDCLSQRAIITAQNIANGGTRGYRPLQVTFEDELQRAATRGPDAVEAVTPHVSQAMLTLGESEMRLDLELANATGTAGRYAALVEVLNRQLQLQSLALNEGR